MESMLIIVIPVSISFVGILTSIVLCILLFIVPLYIYESIEWDKLDSITFINPTLVEDFKTLIKRIKKRAHGVYLRTTGSARRYYNKHFHIGPVIGGSNNTINDVVPHIITEETDSSGHRIVKHTFGTYEVLEIYDIFTKEECDHFIQVANKKGLHESEVTSYDEKVDGVVDKEHRISHQVWLEDTDDPVVGAFASHAAQITGLPVENQESTQVVMYDVGGKFLDHYDACVSDGTSYCDHTTEGESGERWATFILYLNDEFEGGETEFTRLGFSVKPEIGKGLLFWNTDDKQEILEESEHKGSPIIKGKKWIATKWCHFGPYTSVKHPE
jgi:hypothetical protein